MSEQWTAAELLEQAEEAFGSENEFSQIAMEWSMNYLFDHDIEDAELARLVMAGVVRKVSELEVDGCLYPEVILEALYQYVGQEEGYNLNIGLFDLEYEYERVEEHQVDSMLECDKERKRGLYGMSGDGRFSFIYLDSYELDEPNEEDDSTHALLYVTMLDLGRKGNPEYVSEPLHERLMEQVPGFKERYEQMMLSKAIPEVKAGKRLKM
ncbi:MAG TPA: hypothetical protein VM577_18510 [Anaerovoracaceae bacterium]|nr:hypothetical protein [Anaerovoracaceae bacterium]